MVIQAIVRVVVGDPPTLNSATPHLLATDQPTNPKFFHKRYPYMTTQVEPTLANSLQDFLGFARMRGLDAKSPTVPSKSTSP